MIKDILLDMDETILDFTKAEQVALTEALDSFGIAGDEEILTAYSKINKAQWQLLEQGLLRREVLLRRRFELLVQQYGWSVDPGQLAKTYEGNLTRGYYFMDGAEETLKELRKKYNLYLLSNGTSVVQHARIEGTGLEPYFKGIYISEDVGANKPDIEYFRRCFADIAQRRGRPVELSETVMVGDSLTSDIQGGRNAGVVTIWLSTGTVPSGGVQPDHIIADLRQLPGLLERINGKSL
jgi:2-haloacid dehalogenase